VENLGYEINEALQNCEEMKRFSGVIKVAAEDSIVYEKSMGFADRSHEIVNDLETSFGIASGAKLFTAVAILKLVQDKKIRFEDKLKDILDIELPNISEKVTIHHLLTHTSGIEDYFDESNDEDFASSFNGIASYNLRKLKDFLPLIQNNKMKFQPGDRVCYNNGGYLFLGLIIEAVTGKTFHEYVDRKILKPCRLNQTGYFELDALPHNVANGYIDEESTRTWKSNIFSIPAKGGPDGGIFVTANELMKFWDILWEGNFLEQELVDKMLSPQVRMNQLIEYGYGVYILRENNEAKKYFITGMDPGVSFRYSYYPENGFKIVILGNSEFDDYEINEAIVSALKEFGK